jgi:uncharacterized membrane protein
MNSPIEPTPAAVAPTREFSLAWAAYALHGMGAFGILFGPLLGVIINYAKRDADGTGLIASHHRWLIRTFWWTLLGYLVSFAVILASVLPLLRDVLRSATHRGAGRWEFDSAVQIDWSSILTTASGATLGGIGLLVVWLWFVYRLVRGALRLADARVAP